MVLFYFVLFFVLFFNFIKVDLMHKELHIFNVYILMYIFWVWILCKSAQPQDTFLDGFPMSFCPYFLFYNLSLKSSFSFIAVYSLQAITSIFYNLALNIINYSLIMY